jgi:branched-chain amino acid transport system ATP-binding protein
VSLLELNGVHAYYGDSHILFDVSLKVEPGTVVCLLGRNGVGKTTTCRAIMGMTPARSGSIGFAGKDITKKAPYDIAKLGIGYVPEDKRLFPNLSVKETLEIAARKAPNGGEARAWNVERVYQLFPILKERSRWGATQLSGGEQQMLAIARVLMSNAQMLLLDEPTQGLAPIMRQRLADLLKTLAGEGLTILLVEQSLMLALSVSAHAYMMEKGAIVYSGTIDDLRGHSAIVQRYLGCDIPESKVSGLRASVVPA